jgi:hypothetical protein
LLVRSGTSSSRPSGLKITWSASGAANPNPLSGVNGVASERVEPAIGVIVPSAAQRRPETSLPAWSSSLTT